MTLGRAFSHLRGRAKVARMQNQKSPRTLDGVRVLDLSRVLAGPWASQLLGDLGAEIIKIERPGAGDDTRGWGPPFLRNDAGETTDAAYFLSANRNKKSVAIDIAAPEGARLVRRIAATCQIVVENFKVGGLRKYGLDYEALARDNPALVYCSITGFGQTGPDAPRAGYDYMIQAMGGLMSITGQPDGAAGAEPMKVGVAVVDLFSGMYASTAILAALRHAERTGVGQHVDVALFDCQIAMLANQASNFLVSGTAPGRLGNAHPNIAPYQVFSTADGYIVIAVGNDSQFASFVRAVGLVSLGEDERFRTNRARVANRKSLVGMIAPLMLGRSTKDWLDVMEAAGVPAGPINTVDQVFAEPQALARAMTAPIERRDAAGVSMVVHPVKFSQTPAVCDLPPPEMGSHTDEVLSEFADGAELQRLKQSGVVG